jgi:hypothetical protein
VIKLAPTPFSPHLAPANFYLFPLLKSVLKGRRLCDATDIIENATEKLKINSQNGLQEYFQHLYNYWQKCIVAQEDVPEGISLTDCTVLYFSEIKLFRELLKLSRIASLWIEGTSGCKLLVYLL